MIISLPQNEAVNNLLTANTNHYRKYSLIVSSLFVAIFYSGFDIYVYSVLSTSIKPKYIIIMLSVCLLPIIWQHIKTKRVKYNDKLLLFIYINIFIMLVELFANLNNEHFYIFRVQLTGILFFLLAYLVFKDVNIIRWARYTILFIVVLTVFINHFEVLKPGFFSSVPGRSAGTYINPNISALALNAGLVLTIGLLPRKFRLTYIIIVGAGVFSTLSRAGIIIWAIITLFIWLQGKIWVKKNLIWVFLNIFILLCFILFFSHTYLFLPQFHYCCDVQIGNFIKYATNLTNKQIESVRISETTPGTLHNTVGEVSVKNNINQPEKVNFLQINDSTLSRDWLLRNSLIIYRENPLMGVGVGKAWDLSPHNAYVLHGLAYGLIGWLIIPALALIIYLNRYKYISMNMALFLLLAAMFSHNIMVDRTFLIPLAIAASLR